MFRPKTLAKVRGSQQSKMRGGGVKRRGGQR